MPALVRFWPAAALVVSAGACAGLCGGRAFSRLVRRDVEALRAQSSVGRPAVVVTGEMLSEFPEPVRRYLVRAGVVGQAIPGLVRLRQTGRMRLGAGQPIDFGLLPSAFRPRPIRGRSELGIRRSP